MKPLFSEEYYRKYWEQFLVRVPGKHFVDMEKDLSFSMKVYESLGLSEDAVSKIREIEAKKIADRVTLLVRDEMRVLMDVEAGRSSFGYTTQMQEIQARAEFHKRFEFNCLQLRDFTNKYLRRSES